MFDRRLEPELMDDPAEAAAYDAMDHAGVNAAFVADLRDAGWSGEQVLDLGAGTALIPIAMCQANATCRVTAVDGAAAMLEVAARNVASAGLANRIELVLADAKRLPFADGEFTVVASNSIIHHLPDPEVVFQEAVRVAAPGGLLFFRDLMRPESRLELDSLVDLHAGEEGEEAIRMFAESLAAALTLSEAQAIVSQLGIEPRTVAATSDRHWTWSARKHA